MNTATPDPLAEALEAHFGFSTFHKGQRAVIEDVVAGRPTMAVMPTGAGKSLCYQLPALLLDGVTVVVSPLIALMKDQVDGLRARGVVADFVNSSQTHEAQRAALERLRAGESRLVYVAPERFRSRGFLRALADAKVDLFAIDEAHCISRWGHDFRPDYTRLGEVLGRLRPPRLLACTATATPEVRADILEQLGVDDAAVHVAGFLRTNLFLEVRMCSGERDREKRLIAFLGNEKVAEGSIIVYASTRKRVERYADACRQALGAGAVVAYHGGMSDDQRQRAQDRFMSGEARVAVATNAFGMGVDRSDVRAVVHVDLPRTVEGYYQQVGRAGRDREPAHCLMLYSSNDTRVHEFLIERGHPTAEQVGAVWTTLRTHDFPMTRDALDVRLDELGHDLHADACLRQLSRVDAVRYEPGAGGFVTATGAPDDVRALGVDFGRIERHRAHELDKLRQMRRFVHTGDCRHAYVLRYFGEQTDEACPGCDRCSGGGEAGAPGVVYEAPNEEEALLIRKALSGAARAEGRYGVRKVAGMLAGSRAKDIQRTSLPQLSTFGLLARLGSENCVALLQLLVDEGLCRIGAGRYPLLEITREGWEVMQGRADAGFRPPPHLMPGTTAAKRVDMLRGALDEAAEDLVDALRAFRSAEAARQGKPAYVVFADKTMLAIAVARPTDRESFLAVRGLGPGRWETYGEALLEVVRPFVD